mgnify:CR=1 FL=1
MPDYDLSAHGHTGWARRPTEPSELILVERGGAVTICSRLIVSSGSSSSIQDCHPIPLYTMVSPRKGFHVVKVGRLVKFEVEP